MIKDKIFLQIADLLATASHCRSFNVAAIAVINQRIIATGINGTIKGQPNCCDMVPEKPSAIDVPAMSSWREGHREFSKANEIHAEQNMIADAAKRGVIIDGATVYVTHAPCQDCTKLLAASGIKEIIYLNEYDHRGNYDILHGAGIKISRYNDK